MLLDFTLNKYKELCDAFFGCKILIVAKYLSNKLSRGFIILRHDVDRILRNALRIVELEYERGARPEQISIGDYAEIGDRCIISAHSRGSLMLRDKYPRSL